MCCKTHVERLRRLHVLTAAACYWAAREENLNLWTLEVPISIRFIGFNPRLLLVVDDSAAAEPAWRHVVVHRTAKTTKEHSHVPQRQTSYATMRCACNHLCNVRVQLTIAIFHFDTLYLLARYQFTCQGCLTCSNGAGLFSRVSQVFLTRAKVSTFGHILRPHCLFSCGSHRSFEPPLCWNFWGGK